MNYLKASVAAVLVSSCFACGGASAAEINVEITGITGAKGEIRVALFNQTEGWLRKGVGTAHAAAQAGSVKVSFANLPEGEYAVSVVHDVNSNGKLDSNLIGIPVEPFGFSNNAAGSFGPPTFDQAKFKLDAPYKTIAVRLN